MAPRTHFGIFSKFKAFSQASAALTLFSAFFIFGGWIFDIPVLRNILPGFTAMKANTSVGFILLGLSLWFLQSRKPDDTPRFIEWVCAFLVFFLGLFVFSEYLFGWNSGIDQFFSKNLSVRGNLHPGRPSFITTANFLMLGAALLIFDHRRTFKWAQAFTLIAASLSLLAFVGYLYAVPAFYGGSVTHTRVSVYSTILFILFSLGLLCARPDRGVMAVLTDSGAGGIMIRRLLPLAVFFPILLGGLRLIGQHAGLYGTELGTALFVFSLLIVFVSLIFWNTLTLEKIDEKRKRMEEALQIREHHTQLILETANDAFVQINTEGRITEWNRQAEVVFGWSRQESINQLLSQMIIPPQYRQAHLNGLKHFLATGEGPVLNKRIEITALRRNGQEFPIELTISAVKKENGDHTFNAFVNDISERKRALEKQVNLLGELELVNRELNDFAYVVSHDLKAPLRGITSLASWLSTDYTGKIGRQGQEHLHLLIGRAQRMHNLIDGILRYSRVGRVSEEKNVIDLNALVSEVTNSMEVPANIEVRIESPLPVLTGERIQLEQVFQNLLSNAVRYIDKPKGLVRVNCAEENGYWKFRITDNGPGIEEKYFERIFKIFQTLLPRDESESTGIGLAIVKKIVERLGGKVGVESKVGEGSTFFFTLPKT